MANRWSDSSEDTLDERIRQYQEELGGIRRTMRVDLMRVRTDEVDLRIVRQAANSLNPVEDPQLADETREIEQTEGDRLQQDLQRLEADAERAEWLEAEIQRLAALRDACEYLRLERVHVTRAIQVITETTEQRVHTRHTDHVREQRKETIDLGKHLTAKVPSTTHVETQGTDVAGLVMQIAHFMTNVAGIAQHVDVFGDVLRLYGQWLRPFIPLLPQGVRWPA